MGKYVIKRLLHGLVSVIIVVGIVMILVYSLLDREVIFAGDSGYAHTSSNARETYMQSRYQAYGYVDYLLYSDYITTLANSGEIDDETRSEVIRIGKTEDRDSELTAEYVRKFTEEYESQGYTVVRLDADTKSNGQVKDGGQAVLYATRNRPLSTRLIEYFTGMFVVDNIHNVPEEDEIGKRGLTFTLHDPVYNPTDGNGNLINGKKVFAPAIIGNGTTHKYLLYFDGSFPYLHQNFLTIHLGESYTVNRGIDVFETMTATQGSYVLKTMTFPTGLTEESADNLHTATYSSGSRELNQLYAARFTDDYTNVITTKTAMSKLGFSFVIGIISTIMAYCLGLPIGLMMARYKDGLLDKLGTVYIIFIIAVPSLAYIFLFKAVGGSLFKLPTTFAVDSSSKLMYILPIISLALPSVANLMKWMRRYMIDQMNSDYVKFARSGGLSETEIFAKHIWKNALIPITHGIPGSIIFAMTGAIITERVYVVPGAGNLLTEAINKYDNGVIVGVTLFYAILSVVSIILGDVLMSLVDPRISFTDKAR